MTNAQNCSRSGTKIIFQAFFVQICHDFLFADPRTCVTPWPYMFVDAPCVMRDEPTVEKLQYLHCFMREPYKLRPPWLPTNNQSHKPRSPHPDFFCPFSPLEFSIASDPPYLLYATLKPSEGHIKSCSANSDHSMLRRPRILCFSSCQPLTSNIRNLLAMIRLCQQPGIDIKLSLRFDHSACPISN